MPLPIAPLSLAGLSLAAAIDVWLVVDLIEVTTKTPRTLETVEWKPRLSAAGEAIASARPLDDYRQTLARPLFFKTRAPYVPPPPSPPQIQPPQPAPPPVFVDPGFAVGGVMITGIIRKAYLRKKPDPHGVWVREGEEFMGWTVQSITPSMAELQQNGRTIELRLYAGR